MKLDELSLDADWPVIKVQTVSLFSLVAGEAGVFSVFANAEFLLFVGESIKFASVGSSRGEADIVIVISLWYFPCCGSESKSLLCFLRDVSVT